MAIDVARQRVLVVGAAGGIGQATARAFAAAGAKVTLAGRTETSVATVAQEMGGDAVQIDILDNEQVEAFFDREEPFDHVIVAAASTATGTVAGLPLDQAKSSMESKFWGAYRIARAACIADRGSLTLISGLLAERPSATSVLQGAINAALEALVRGLALERSPIRVNAVSPGLIATPLHDRMAPDARIAMYDVVQSKLPVRRVGEPEDVARAVLLVATNQFITGATINVDGGGRIV